ncbi:MAG: Rieske (2Fe-2S) protein [Planctomycetota bacterium]
MPDYRAVCRADEVPPGAGRLVEPGGRALALFNVDGRFYAVDNTCLHAGGPICEGTLDGATVTCPWHGWRFDVITGRTPMNSKVALDCFAVRVRDGMLEVEV